MDIPEIRSIECPICKREIRFEVKTSSNPDIPDLFQVEDSNVWFGVVRDEAGAPEIVGVCSKRCRDDLFAIEPQGEQPC